MLLPALIDRRSTPGMLYRYDEDEAVDHLTAVGTKEMPRASQGIYGYSG